MVKKSILQIKKHSSSFGILLTLIMILYFSGCATAGYDSQRSSGNNNYNDNNSYVNENEVLDTYGEWIDVAPYGTVWRPFVSQDWQPYHYGNWIRTENGWTWVSYEPFGWIVYHYGYWDYRPETGWFWIESRDWTPARVQWAYEGDYVGWAPMPPPQGGYFDQPATQINVWNVVDIRNFTQNDVGRYRLRRIPQGFRNHMGETPDINTVERYTNRQVRIVHSNRERVNVNGRQYDRLVLPDREAATVREYQPQVTRDVIRTRNDVKRNNVQPDYGNNNGNVIRSSDPSRSTSGGNTSGARNNNGTRNDNGSRDNRGNSVRTNNGNSNNNNTTTPDNQGKKVVVPDNPRNRVVVPSEPKKPETPNTRVTKPAEPAGNPNVPRGVITRERPQNQGHGQQPPQQQQRPPEQKAKPDNRGNRSERQNRDGQKGNQGEKERDRGRESREETK